MCEWVLPSLYVVTARITTLMRRRMTKMLEEIETKGVHAHVFAYVHMCIHIHVGTFGQS